MGATLTRPFVVLLVPAGHRAYRAEALRLEQEDTGVFVGHVLATSSELTVGLGPNRRYLKIKHHPLDGEATNLKEIRIVPWATGGIVPDLSGSQLKDNPELREQAKRMLAGARTLLGGLAPAASAAARQAGKRKAPAAAPAEPPAAKRAAPPPAKPFYDSYIAGGGGFVDDIARLIGDYGRFQGRVRARRTVRPRVSPLNLNLHPPRVRSLLRLSDGSLAVLFTNFDVSVWEVAPRGDGEPGTPGLLYKRVWCDDQDFRDDSDPHYAEDAPTREGGVATAMSENPNGVRVHQPETPTGPATSYSLHARLDGAWTRLATHPSGGLVVAYSHGRAGGALTVYKQPPHGGAYRATAQAELGASEVRRVTRVTSLPNGLIAVGYNDGNIQVWVLEGDGRETKLRQVYELAYPPTDEWEVSHLVAVSPSRLISIYLGGEGKRHVVAWDLSEDGIRPNGGEPSWSVNVPSVFSGVPDRGVVGLAEDGVAVTVNKAVLVLDAKGAVTATLRGHTNFVTCLAVLADGTLASGSTDRSVRVWDTQSGRCLHRLEVDHPITNLVSLPGHAGEDLLATASHETGRVTVWE